MRSLLKLLAIAIIVLAVTLPTALMWLPVVLLIPLNLGVLRLVWKRGHGDPR